MFLTTQDLDTSIYPEIKQAIARNQADIVNVHINEALSFIQSRLLTKYDIAAEFAKNGDARHPLLLKYAKDITVYYLYDLPESIPAKRVKAYMDAEKWLDDLNKGFAVLAGVAPAPVDEDAPVLPTNAQFGSIEKRNNNDW
jgi:Protein of unknown function (DUF1320)